MDNEIPPSREVISEVLIRSLPNCLVDMAIWLAYTGADYIELGTVNDESGSVVKLRLTKDAVGTMQLNDDEPVQIL